MDLQTNMLLDTQCMMSMGGMWICMGVGMDIQDGGCSSHSNIVSSETKIWYWAEKHNHW